MFDAAFVIALRLHDFEEQGNVERDHGNRGTGLGDNGLVDGDEGAATVQLHEVVDLAAGPLEVFLGLADGAVLVDGPGDLRSDIGIGDRLAAFLDHTGAVEGVHPELPVFAPHDLDGVGNFLGVRGVEGHVVHDLTVGVEVLGVEGRAGWLERRLVGDAIWGGPPRGGE